MTTNNYSLLSAEEYHELLDFVSNSKFGQRIVQLLQSRFQADENEEYPEEYWNELSRFHTAGMACWIAHTNDTNRKFREEIN